MSRRGWLLFAAMGFIWGIPYLLIKVAVEELAPSTVVLGRTGLAAVLLVPLAAARGQLRPLLPHWRPLLLFTLVEVCGPWVLLGYAEQDLSSSLTGLLVAAVPLVSAVLVKATKQEAMSVGRVVGLLVGFAGVATLVGFDVEASSMGAVGAVGLVAILYAIGPLILARNLSDLPGLGVIAASLAIAATLYLPLGLAQLPAETPHADTVWAVVGLGLICTAIAFIVFFALIAEVGPARATVITYVNPAVALTLGAVVLDERITVATGMGFALILAGSVLSTRRERVAEPVPEAAPAPAELVGARSGAPPDGGTGEPGETGGTGVTGGDVAACPVAEG
jgi:drug/metabolite transporter (DMT)-like permease